MKKWNMVHASPPLTHEQLCSLLVTELWMKARLGAPRGVVVVTLPDAPTYRRQPFLMPRVEFADHTMVAAHLRNEGSPQLRMVADAIETTMQDESVHSVGIAVALQDMRVLFPNPSVAAARAATGAR